MQAGDTKTGERDESANQEDKKKKKHAERQTDNQTDSRREGIRAV